jgi:hypothetical protein
LKAILRLATKEMQIAKSQLQKKIALLSLMFLLYTARAFSKSKGRF